MEVDCSMHSLPNDVLMDLLAMVTQHDGQMATAALVCKRWAAACDDLVSFWQLTAMSDDFAVVQYASRWREHVRVTHVPTASVLTVHDIGTEYDPACKPSVSIVTGSTPTHIDLTWMQTSAHSAGHGLKSTPTRGTWVQRRMRISRSGLCWAGDAAVLLS